MSKGLVVVTGASGFIAKHIVLQLLNLGYSVRATVRSPSREAELRAAMSQHADAGTSVERLLSFALLDLEQDQGWDEALAGADALIHTASPFPLVQPKNEDDVVRPAVDGTLRALRAAKRANVSRIVLTSSGLAVLLAKPNGKLRLDESDWSSPNDPRATPYAKSKILAEKAAWTFVEAEPAIELTVINPGFVIGAPLRSFLWNLAASDPAAPSNPRTRCCLAKFGFPIVDVRDVTRMHVACLALPETSRKTLPRRR